MPVQVLMPTNAVSVEQWFNGLYTAVMLLTIWTISHNQNATRRNKAVWTALVLLMYTCATVHCSMNWSYEFEGGIGFPSSLANVSPAVHFSQSSALVLSHFVADWLSIWRCWMVWQRRWIVIVLPIASSITAIVMAALAFRTANILLNSPDLPDNVFEANSKMYLDFANVFVSSSIATSVTTTLLITLRIALVQRHFRKAGLKITSYSAMVEILVESAALYSLTLLIFVILQSVKNEALYYPQNIHAQVAGLAPTLIILRVAAGLSRPERASDWSICVSNGDSPENRVSPEMRSVIRFGSSNNAESEV